MNLDESFWQEARRLIPLNPVKINLNAGTLWPTPLPILEVVDRIRRRMAQNPSDFVWRQLPLLIQASRARLAQYLHCPAADLLLLPSVTFAINMIAESLRLPPGSEILTTDHEYGAMILAWKRLAEQHGLKLREIKLPYYAEDPAEIVDVVSRGIGTETRILFFSHINTSTGLMMPASDLCALARQRGLLSVIDGAHAPGMVPIDLSQIQADFYAANCHKWLMAPPGAGFMHVAPQHKSNLQPLVTSWGWGYDSSKAQEDSGNGGSRWQWDLEFHGTADRCPQMVLPQCLDLRESLGGDEAILNRCRSISNHARKALSACGLSCVTPENPQMNGGALTAFDFPCYDLIRARNRFWHDFNIECPVTMAGGKTFLRVSTAWFNTTEEIDRLAAAVRELRPAT